MTALVALALAWTFLAVATAFVVGHGIRLADARIPTRTGRDEVRPATRERQAVPTS
ncbi:hypothetical protein [Blastococcus goldschmidtiae]|uniref:Uncharacterized protein n=1 Tax=Blastococcus goldschmidtiae TaxID=3075546 RepID=A0ABU2KAY9_9ACTN|nr:hypothetical protein [Blastococcus sp. DSM 46792]MDT0277357.1 hypothetical protein [Blastococcus sp. DSM 46792]